MKASLSLNGEVRSRDIQQFLHTYSANSDKKVFLYSKDQQIFLTTELSEASASKNSRKELLANLKNVINKSNYGGEIQSLLRDIRNLAKTLPSKGETNLFEDQNHYLSLTSEQLGFLVNHRNNPNIINSDTSRGKIIDNSIRSMKNSLIKYSAASEKSPAYDPEKMQKTGSAIGKELAEKMMSDFKKQKAFSSPVEKQIFSILFFTDDIKIVKESIRNYCLSEFSGKLDDYQLAAIATGVQHSLANIQPQSIQNFNMRDGETISLADTLKLNNQTYNLVTPDYAGKGGHGFIHMYQNQSMQQEFIAIKSPVKCDTPENTAESNEVSQFELTMHMRAQGVGHENVVEVKGAFMVDGKMCIALEDCSFGVLDSFVNGKLRSIADNTDHEKGVLILTLSRDVLRGLDFLHADSKIIHGDFKPQNVFIGVDGKAKIGDFDRSAAGTSVKRDEKFLPDTAQYTAPSLIDQKTRYREQTSEINKKFNALVTPVRNRKSELALEKNKTKESNELEDKLSADVKKFEAERRTELSKVDKSLQFSQSDDSYAAGVTLYELCFGSNPFISTNSATVSDTSAEGYGKLSAEQRSAFLFNNKKLSPGLQQHASELRNLISGLMDPDPATRLSAGDALKSPVFADDEIGADHIRQIIVAVGNTKIS